MQIGIDIEQVSRFNIDVDSQFLKDNFSKQEIDYSFKRSLPNIHLCGIFCAKEAIQKTLSSKEKILMKNIEIYHENKKPLCTVIINGVDEGNKFKISISHSGEYSIAQAVRLNG